MEINVHDDDDIAKLIENPDRIRAEIREISYKNGIYILSCIDDKGKAIELKANSKRAIKALSEGYEKNLPKNWISNIINQPIKITSSRAKDNPLNWFIFNGFIAFFTTDNFEFVEIDKIKSMLQIPSNWILNTIEEKKGLFGGKFELISNDKSINVDTGINHGNSSISVTINGTPVKDKLSHKLGGNQNVAKYLNQLMYEVTIRSSEEKTTSYEILKNLFNQARIEFGLNEILNLDDVLSKMKQIAENRGQHLSNDWEKVAKDKIKNEWATDKPR